MSDLLWYRLGDGGEYCEVGNDISALADVLVEAEVGPDFNHTPLKISYGKWRDWNYISAFWGDEDADMSRGLSDCEVEELRTILMIKQ